MATTVRGNFDFLREHGYNVYEDERITHPVTGWPAEQGIDTELHVVLKRIIRSHAEAAILAPDVEHLARIILVTGDGAAGEISQDGFHTYVQRALECGIAVEVWSFWAATSWTYKELAKAGSNLFSLVTLDNYAAAIERCHGYCF